MKLSDKGLAGILIITGTFITISKLLDYRLYKYGLEWGSDNQLAIAIGVTLIVAGIVVAKRNEDQDDGQSRTLLDDLNEIKYGKDAVKTANLDESIKIAHEELLLELISKQELIEIATELYNSSTPHSTNDLAFAVALNFFRRDEYKDILFEAHIPALSKLNSALESESINLFLASTFEKSLYDIFRKKAYGADIDVNGNDEHIYENDEHIYEQVAKEFSTDTIHQGLWLKVQTEMGGNEAKTKALYTKIRVSQIKKAEQERIEQEEEEKKEQERIEEEKKEQERIEQDKLEQERIEQDKLEQERIEQERKKEKRRKRKEVIIFILSTAVIAVTTVAKFTIKITKKAIMKFSNIKFKNKKNKKI